MIAHHHTPRMVLRSAIFNTPKSGKIIHNWIQIAHLQHTWISWEVLFVARQAFFKEKACIYGYERPVECRSVKKASVHIFQYGIEHNPPAMSFKSHCSSPIDKTVSNGSALNCSVRYNKLYYYTQHPLETTPPPIPSPKHKLPFTHKHSSLWYIYKLQSNNVIWFYLHEVLTHPTDLLLLAVHFLVHHHYPVPKQIQITKTNSRLWTRIEEALLIWTMNQSKCP